MIPRGLNNRLTDGDNVVSPTHRPRSVLQKHYFSASGAHSCWRLSKPQGLERPEGLTKLETFNNLIGSRTRDLPAYSLVP
jgi:hypothetical protein